MITPKTLRFYWRLATAAPQALPSMIWRSGVEAVSTPPVGLSETKMGDVILPVDLSLHALVKKYYFQTHEMPLEPVFKAFLKPGGTFLDIGANCGYWSAFALSLVGNTGAVHAFEPVPAYAALVGRIGKANPAYALTVNNAACGSASGSLKMAVVTASPDNFNNFDTNIGSNSLLPGFLDHDERLLDYIDVSVVRLDDYIADKQINLDAIGLIKIDVEGFESAVMEGASELLAKKGRKIPILCEVLTDRTRKPVLDGACAIAILERAGYRCFDAISRRPVKPSTFNFEENILAL